MKKLKNFALAISVASFLVVGVGCSSGSNPWSKFADEVCKCETKKCANASLKKFMTKEPSSESDQKKVEKAEKRAQACIKKLKK